MEFDVETSVGGQALVEEDRLLDLRRMLYAADRTDDSIDESMFRFTKWDWLPE